MKKASSTRESAELRHEAQPGYRRIFAIAIALMGIYLAIILISSPGSAKSHGPKSESHP